MISIDLSFEQLVKALRGLSPQEKIALWRLLDEDIDRSAIAQNFAEALRSIRSTYPDVGEDEVMADVLRAVQEARAEGRHAQGRP